MSETHPLRYITEAVTAALTDALAVTGDPAAAGMSGLADTDIEDLTTQVWRLLQQLQGTLLVPTVAEADQRRLHKTRRYEGAASMRDLISGWLRCDPSVAGRLLKVGKHCVNGPFTATGASLASGAIDVEHATKVVTAVRRLPSIIDRDQRLEAEGSMLAVAKTTTPEVTGKAGYRLLELVAPHEAADYLDHKAERERRQAEEARWWEVTTTPIAGCKELRLRLEASTMNTLSRLVESLTQPGAGDQPSLPVPGGGAAPAGDESHDTREQDNSGGALAAGTQARAGVVVALPAGGVSLPAGVVALPAGGAPGAATVAVGLLPLERRRADAMAELVHAMAQPHPADELDPTQLRRLADQLEADDAASTDATSTIDDGGGEGQEDGGGQILLDTCDNQDQDQKEEQRQGSVVIPAQRASPNNPPAAAPDSALGSAPGSAPGSAVGPSRGAAAGTTRDRAPSHSSGTTRDTARVTVPGGSSRGSGFRGERASLIVITNYDHALRRYRAGEATAPGAPAPSTLSPTDVQVLECEALVTPVWMTENQTPVSVASSNRYFRGKQLAALIARDRGCCFPGCGRGLRYAHAHHILPVSKGGQTKVDNGVMLCGTHHRLIHTEKSWIVRLAEDRLPEFIPPYHLDPSRAPRRHTRHELRLPVAA